MKKLMLAILIAAAASGAFAQTKGIEGYLVDVLCGGAGYPEGYRGKIDLTVTPEKNIVACLTMDNCAASGFGLYVAGSRGKYVFHPFDKASSDFVKKQVVDRLKNKTDPAPFIELDGKVASTGVIYDVRKAAVSKKSAPSAASSGMDDHGM